jgi:hypothetical protein
LCLLQLFLSPAFSEVRTLIEVKEEHEEDDWVDEQHSCHQFWISAVKYENLSWVYEHQGELQLWKRVRCYTRCTCYCVTAGTQSSTATRVVFGREEILDKNKLVLLYRVYLLLCDCWYPQ